MALNSLNINPDDMIIDVQKLAGADIAALVKFLSDNGKTMTARLNETARVHLLKGEVPGNDPMFASDPDFQQKKQNSWYASLRGRVCHNTSKGSVISLLFPVAVYLYESYGLSCSKFLLGTETSIVPPRWLRSWLTQVEFLNASETAQLYDILEKGRRIRADVLYTLKTRIEEQAAEKGMAGDDYCFYPGILILDVSQVRDFVEIPLREYGNPYSLMKQHLGNHKLLRLLISMCITNQMSPDYFLLQDYSPFCVTPDGRYYPPSSRNLMSLLLNADSATRSRAVGFVFAATASRLAKQEILPSAISIDEEEDAQALNVIAALSEGRRSTSKKKSDQQIVETLKPKIYELLLLSNSPVSSKKLYSHVIDGHPRLARLALFALEREGKIERIPMPRGASYWKIKQKSKRASDQ